MIVIKAAAEDRGRCHQGSEGKPERGEGVEHAVPGVSFGEDPLKHPQGNSDEQKGRGELKGHARRLSMPAHTQAVFRGEPIVEGRHGYEKSDHQTLPHLARRVKEHHLQGRTQKEPGHGGHRYDPRPQRPLHTEKRSDLHIKIGARNSHCHRLHEERRSGHLSIERAVDDIHGENDETEE